MWILCGKVKIVTRAKNSSEFSYKYLPTFLFSGNYQRGTEALYEAACAASVHAAAAAEGIRGSSVQTSPTSAKGGAPLMLITTTRPSCATAVKQDEAEKLL